MDKSSYPRRKPTRIPRYDYSTPNYYFVTICTHEKRCLFGLPDSRTSLGAIAESELRTLPQRYPGVKLDQAVVMPNHVHLILVLEPDTPIPLHQIIGGYKAGVSRRIHGLDQGVPVWQRSFHDHVIRKQETYETIWTYIQDNPRKWSEDCFYCE